MNASEHISMGLDSHKRGHMQWEDAHTLIRVLCHKKDREASKFLKRQYDLPMSSGNVFVQIMIITENQNSVPVLWLLRCCNLIFPCLVNYYHIINYGHMQSLMLVFSVASVFYLS